MEHNVKSIWNTYEKEMLGYVSGNVFTADVKLKINT